MTEVDNHQTVQKSDRVTNVVSTYNNVSILVVKNGILLVDGLTTESEI